MTILRLWLHVSAIVGAHILTVVDVEATALAGLIVSSHIQFICSEIDIEESHLLVSTKMDGILALFWQSKV